MPTTMQNVIDRARVPLNDSAKARYTDAVLLGYANDAINILRVRRPDLFYGNFGALSTLIVSDTMPVNAIYLPVVADYVTARASALDAEFAEDARAKAFFALFTQGAA